MALDERQILNIVSEELSQSSGGNEHDFIDSNRKDALAAYLGQKDGKETEGRSQIISTDVADAIEWLMPEVMKAFTQNNEVVTFDPVFNGDEEQAEMESVFVYDILMKDNNGFLALHQFFKDALMQKNGFLKVFYESSEESTTEHYTGLIEQELQALSADPECEIVEMTQDVDAESQLPIADVKVRRTVKDNKINVLCIPPEEFRANRMHNQVDLSTARFTAHVVLKTAGDLVRMGHSKEFVDSIPSSQVYTDDREYRWYMQDEVAYPNREINSDPSLRTIEVSECYMHIDIDEDGIPELMKITVAGGDNPDIVLDMEPVDAIPFISSTAILMSHKLFGLSIYDRLKQIQDQKTTLWRNIFDNLYLQNNQRTIAVEGQVNLDDLMTSRPGGIIRVKRADAIQPFVTPPLSGDAYTMMEYLDKVRSGRTGVTPEGPIADSLIGDNMGSEGVQQMMNQREELVGLIIRVFAETGIKPLCWMIREQLIKHQDVMSDYKHKGRWIQVDPKRWRKRKNSTVRVGTGSGNRKEQVMTMTQILTMQQQIMANPAQSLMTEKHLFKAMHDYAKFAGLAGVGQYFLDPESPEGQQNKKGVDEKNAKEKEQVDKRENSLAEAQAKIAEAELGKAQAAQQSVQLKGQVEQVKSQLVLQEQESDLQIDMLKQRLSEAEAIAKADGDDAQLQFKYWEARLKAQMEQERLNSQEQVAKENRGARQQGSTTGAGEGKG